jgi:antitoxin PrlF
MTAKNYPITPAKIGNQDGFRLPQEFSKDYPHLVSVNGHVEVLDKNTILIRLDANEETEDNDNETLMMSLFLDTLLKEVIKDPSSLVPYTEEMSKEMDNLLEGVTLEE